MLRSCWRRVGCKNWRVQTMHYFSDSKWFDFFQLDEVAMDFVWNQIIWSLGDYIQLLHYQNDLVASNNESMAQLTRSRSHESLDHLMDKINYCPSIQNTFGGGGIGSGKKRIPWKISCSKNSWSVHNRLYINILNLYWTEYQNHQIDASHICEIKWAFFLFYLALSIFPSIYLSRSIFHLCVNIQVYFFF